VNLAAAHNKLRQAELLCSYLQQLPNEIAQDMRKARSDTGGHRLKLETFFSAAMGAANSSFYILAKTGGPPFKLVLADWKMNALDQDGRTQFNRMLNLRGTDVHFGEIPAVVSPLVFGSSTSCAHLFVQQMLRQPNRSGRGCGRPPASLVICTGSDRNRLKSCRVYQRT
jgi:hypothetical protein